MREKRLMHQWKGKKGRGRREGAMLLRATNCGQTLGVLEGTSEEGGWGGSGDTWQQGVGVGRCGCG